MAVAKDTQQFCVRWNSYQLNLQSAFPKLLTSEHFVDVTLACESRMVKCHKLVLSACSAYFEKLLVQNPCPHPIIFMKDMKYWEVQALVDFMYKGEVNVTQEELGTLLKAAEALEVRGLCGQQHDNSLADKLSLPRDTVMANDNVPTQKKRKGENESKEESAASNTSTNSMKIEPGTAPSSSTLVPKSPNNQDINKTSNTPTLSTPNTSVKQEMNVADNGLFEDLDDDFYQDDNSLQIDETGSAYSLPGPSGQPPLDNSPDTGHWNFNNGYPNVILTESNNYNTPSPSNESPNKIQRIRRSDAELLSAADSICKGMTFQKASQVFNIPMSTIRFYMARKGMLPSRRRGRRISQAPPDQQQQPQHHQPHQPHQPQAIMNNTPPHATTTLHTSQMQVQNPFYMN